MIDGIKIGIIFTLFNNTKGGLMNAIPSTIPQSEAEALLQPHLPIIANSMQTAWREWQILIAHPEGIGQGLGKNTRANFIRDRVWYHFQAQFSDSPTVKPVNKSTRRLLLINNEILLGVNKLNRQRLTSRNNTYQQHLFEMQQLSLEGIPQLLNLTAGYMLNYFESEIEGLAITCEYNKRLSWHSPILVCPNMGLQIDIEHQTTQQTTQRTRKVVRKSDDNDKSRTGTE